MSGKWERRLVLLNFYIGAKLLSRAGNREAFLIQKLLNAQHGFDIFAAVHALSGAAFYGFELRKLRFPEAENVRGQPA